MQLHGPSLQRRWRARRQRRCAAQGRAIARPFIATPPFLVVGVCRVLSQGRAIARPFIATALRRWLVRWRARPRPCMRGLIPKAVQLHGPSLQPTDFPKHPVPRSCNCTALHCNRATKSLYDMPCSAQGRAIARPVNGNGLLDHLLGLTGWGGPASVGRSGASLTRRRTTKTARVGEAESRRSLIVARWRF